MTLENYLYRTSPMFLRNQFKTNDSWEIPLVSKTDLELSDGQRVIPFSKVKSGKDDHFDRIVHFFLYDYCFEDIWKTPDKYVETLKKYKAVLTPDFSMYVEMNLVLQLYNTFRNRWVGAYLSKKGIRVIPTVNWGSEKTFDFCFKGIEKNSTVAVSTYMVSEHGNHKAQKEFFLKGYNEMLKRIEPECIICYGEPFPEMSGNILHIDYNLSSWQHYDDDHIIAHVKYTKGNINPSPQALLKKFRGYILPETNKGSGSAYGGEWQPKKEKDKRFLGKPNEINRTVMNGGEVYETKIGEDGRATMERHHTTHFREYTGHTNPHDHIITWNDGYPSLGPPINYHDNIPEFKKYNNKESGMSEIVGNVNYLSGFDNYESIEEFKWSMVYGGELEFMWKDKGYTIFRKEEGFNIGEWNYIDEEGVVRYKLTGEVYPNYEGITVKTIDSLLDLELDGDKLRNIVTQIDVKFRSI